MWSEAESQWKSNFNFYILTLKSDIWLDWWHQIINFPENQLTVHCTPFRLHCSALAQELAGRPSSLQNIERLDAPLPSIHTLSTDFAFHSLTVVALNHIKYHSECTTTNYFKVKIRKKFLGSRAQPVPPRPLPHWGGGHPLCLLPQTLLAFGAQRPFPQTD